MYIHYYIKASLVAHCLQYRRPRFSPWVGKIPWRRKWQPTPVFLPGESHGQRSLASYNPWGHKESDMTEQLSTSTILKRGNQGPSIAQGTRLNIL